MFDCKLYYHSIADRRQIMSEAAKSFDSNSSSTTLKETRIDNRIECSASLPPKKSTHKVPLQRQDSVDQSQNISNNNQDVSISVIFLFVYRRSSNRSFQCIVVLSQEPLFDTSDLASLKSDCDINRPTSPMGRYGSVEISLLYDAPMRKMTVHVIQARGIPCHKGQPTHTQVSCHPPFNSLQLHNLSSKFQEYARFESIQLNAQ